MLTWPLEVQEHVAAAQNISLFLDFDGTLAPIVDDPAEVWLDPSTRSALAELSGKNDIVTTIISGRAIYDLRMRVNLPDLIYAGNRGLEISGRRLEFVEPVAASQSGQLLEITDLLAAGLHSIPGVWVEFKGLTTTVHYRRAADADVPVIERAVRAAVTPFPNLFQVDPGKKALDIVPRTGWHKGCAVSWILGRLGLWDSLCIYFGDDGTDEDAFGTLSRALTVKVGADSESRAKYHVESPTEVREFLQWLVITR
jgi:trehalose 6-phosphate phosphatase